MELGIKTENKTAKMRTVAYAVVGADGKPETRTASFMSTAPEGEADDKPTQPPPPCGHPGNNPGGGLGPEEGGGTPEDHPGNTESGGLGQPDHPGSTGAPGGNTNASDHPGDVPSPPCKN